MSPKDALLSVAVALAAGALVGAEREQAHAARGQEDFGGVRTFPLIALLGALGAMLRPALGGFVLAAFLVAVIAMLVASRARAKSEDRGITSEVAAVVTFALGALSTSVDVLPNGPRLLLVVGLAAVTMALLAVKGPLHEFLAGVSRDDVYATAKFVVLALVALPLLPNRTFGPLGVLNPFKIGLFIVLVAGVSFAGYVVARLVGSRRGLLLVGLIGGLVSSTAVTLTLSRRAREQTALVPTSALAILAACSMMFLRVLVMVAVVFPPLALRLAVPLGAMALSGFGIAVFMARRSRSKAKPEDAVPLKNPFELRYGLEFGLLYALILLVAKTAEHTLGASGLYASSILAGFADVDAIALTLTELHRSGMDGGVVARSIVLAVVTNTLVKLGLATLVGNRALGARLAVPFVCILLGGGAGLIVEALVSAPFHHAR